MSLKQCNWLLQGEGRDGGCTAPTRRSRAATSTALHNRSSIRRRTSHGARGLTDHTRVKPISSVKPSHRAFAASKKLRDIQIAAGRETRVTVSKKQCICGSGENGV